MTEIPADRQFDGPATGDYLDDLGDQSVVDGEQNHRFRNWVVGIALVLIGVSIIAALWIGNINRQTSQMLKQLPGMVVVEDGATLVDYIVGSGGKEDRLKLAIFAAERMKRPLTAVETKIAGRDKPLLSKLDADYRYGKEVPVTYDQARSLVAYSDSIKVNMLIYPGDLLDPKRGKFISRDDPQAVLDYIIDNTTCNTPAQSSALAAFAAGQPKWVAKYGYPQGPLDC